VSVAEHPELFKAEWIADPIRTAGFGEFVDASVQQLFSRHGVDSVDRGAVPGVGIGTLAGDGDRGIDCPRSSGRDGLAWFGDRSPTGWWQVCAITQIIRVSGVMQTNLHDRTYSDQNSPDELQSVRSRR
jgi:hypothetical protein